VEPRARSVRRVHCSNACNTAPTKGQPPRVTRAASPIAIPTTTRTVVKTTSNAVSQMVGGLGQPQTGHAMVRLLTAFPQSGHFVSMKSRPGDSPGFAEKYISVGRLASRGFYYQGSARAGEACGAPPGHRLRLDP
jgi:hypothetical protein